MIYFDDELPPAPKRQRSRFERWLRRFLTVSLVLAVILWIGLRLLMNFAGNGDAQKTFAENYLVGATGMPARVGTLNWLAFYPNVVADMSNVQFGNFANGTPDVTLGSLKIAVNFWDVFFGRGRMSALDLKRLDLRDKFKLPRLLQIDSAVLQKKEAAKQGGLLVKGYYGPDSFTLSQALQWSDRGNGRVYYSRPASGAVFFHSLFLNLNGTLSTAPGGGMQFDFDIIGLPRKMLVGRVVLREELGGALSIKADLRGGHSEFILDATDKKNNLAFTLNAPAFDPADAKILLAVRAAFDLLTPHYAVDADPLLKGTVKITTTSGAASFPLSAKSGVFSAGPAAGDIATGQLLLDSLKIPAKLSAGKP